MEQVYGKEAIDIIKSKNIIYEGEKEDKTEHTIHLKICNRYDDPPKVKKDESFNKLDDVVKFILERKFSETEKILEKTDTSKHFFRMFFDIEGKIEVNLLGELIEDFKKYIENEYHMKCEESWTQNNKSVHGDNSYHLFFNIYTSLGNMPFIVNGFHIFSKYKYQPYIDMCVYTYGRIFRVPYSLRPQQKSLSPGDGRDILNQEDFHDIKKGTLETCLISNILGCYKIIDSFILPIKTTGGKPVKISGDNKTKELIVDEGNENYNKEVVNTLDDIKNSLKKF